MLGSDLCLLLHREKIDYVATSLEVDICDKTSLQKFLGEFSQREEITHIINCAAYTAVDLAEDESELAYRVNVLGAKNLADLSRENNYTLIHFSTDYVFDGETNSPLTEDHPVAPIGVYGKTKYEGEEAIRESGCSSYLIRTAWLYGSHGKNFVDTMLSLMNTKESLKIVDDQHGSPTWTVDLSRATLAILQQTRQNREREDLCEIYHFSNLGETTWFEFGCEIYRRGRALDLITSECDISPCSSSEFPTKAKRPSYSLLSKEKIERTFGLTIPRWEESLEKYLSTKGVS